jgi:hypothetical protein
MADEATVTLDQALAAQRARTGRARGRKCLAGDASGTLCILTPALMTLEERSVKSA